MHNSVIQSSFKIFSVAVDWLTVVHIVTVAYNIIRLCCTFSDSVAFKSVSYAYINNIRSLITNVLFGGLSLPLIGCWYRLIILPRTIQHWTSQIMKYSLVGIGVILGRVELWQNIHTACTYIFSYTKNIYSYSSCLRYLRRNGILRGTKYGLFFFKY